MMASSKLNNTELHVMYNEHFFVSASRRHLSTEVTFPQQPYALAKRASAARAPLGLCGKHTQTWSVTTTRSNLAL